MRGLGVAEGTPRSGSSGPAPPVCGRRTLRPTAAGLKSTSTSGQRCLFPSYSVEWYGSLMSGTYQTTVGDRGRLVIPAELRDRAGLTEGTTLTLIETPGGLVLLTRPQLRALVRADLAGLDLVGELLAERRVEAAAEGVG